MSDAEIYIGDGSKPLEDLRLTEDQKQMPLLILGRGQDQWKYFLSHLAEPRHSEILRRHKKLSDRTREDAINLDFFLFLIGDRSSLPRTQLCSPSIRFVRRDNGWSASWEENIRSPCFDIMSEKPFFREGQGSPYFAVVFDEGPFEGPILQVRSDLIIDDKRQPCFESHGLVVADFREAADISNPQIYQVEDVSLRPSRKKETAPLKVNSQQ